MQEPVVQNDTSREPPFRQQPSTDIAKPRRRHPVYGSELAERAQSLDESSFVLGEFFAPILSTPLQNGSGGDQTRFDLRTVPICAIPNGRLCLFDTGGFHEGQWIACVYY